MDSGHSNTRMNVAGDRLSNLPDDLILKILSFIDTKRAVTTSVLSSRWRYIWTSTSRLTFSTEDFRTLAKFSKFVTGVLSRRSNQIELDSVELTLPALGKVSQAFFKRILNRILNYSFTHSVQQLNVSCMHGTEFQVSCFRSQSLKHLTLIGFTCENSITTPSTWELSGLTTLNLKGVTLYDNTDGSVGLFSNCTNLKNLTISYCKTRSKRFNICHPGLSDLTLKNGHEDCDVVTPQLKNLSIRNWSGIRLISAPELASLQYEGFVDPLQVSADLVHLEKVDMCVHYSCGGMANADEIVCLLQKLHSVKYLSVNLDIIKILCSYVELISHQPSPFANLKSLKIYPDCVNHEKQTQPKVTVSTEVKNYLLDGSPGATFTMLSHEDVRALKKASWPKNLLRSYRRC